MSSSDPIRNVPRRLVILAGLVLGACGFQPVYAPGGAALTLLDRVSVETAATPFDFRLRSAIEDRLGLAATPAFRLTVASSVDEVSAAIAPDGSITRFNLTGAANWSLIDAASSTELATGQVDSFTSYAATGTTVATRTAENDASDRLASALADLILARLLIAVQGV